MWAIYIFRGHKFSQFHDIPEHQDEHELPSKLKPNIFMQHEMDRNGFHDNSHEQVARRRQVVVHSIYYI